MAGPFITMVLAFRGGHAALPPLPLDMAEPELRPRVALPRLQYQGPSFGFEGPYWGLNKTDQAIGRIPIKKSISKVFAHSHFSSVESKSLRYNGWIILECPPFLIGLHLVEHEGRSQAEKKLWNTSKQHSTECNRVSGSGFLKLCRSLRAKLWSCPSRITQGSKTRWFDCGSSLVSENRATHKTLQTQSSSAFHCPLES